MRGKIFCHERQRNNAIGQPLIHIELDFKKTLVVVSHVLLYRNQGGKSMKQAKWTFADLKITPETMKDEYGRTRSLFHIQKDDMPISCQGKSPTAMNLTDFWLRFCRKHCQFSPYRLDTVRYTIQPEKSIPPEEHPGGFYVLFTFPLEDFMHSFTMTAKAAVEAANDRLSPADILISQKDLSALGERLVGIDANVAKIVYLPVV